MSNSSLLSRKGLFESIAAFGALAAVGAAPAIAAPSEVTGAWRLESFDVDEPGGTRKPRFGPNPVGYLMYTPSGKMSAVLGGVSRDALEYPSGASSTKDQLTQSLSNFLAYAGSYEIKGDHVFHHVETSVFTNLIGKTLERKFSIDGDTLTIHTLPPEIWGTSNVLVWKRA